jgi:hypothetical protein
VIILLSQSPSRKQAIKALLGILQKQIPVCHVPDMNEVEEILQLRPSERIVLILDNWYPKDEKNMDLSCFLNKFTELRIVLLVENEPEAESFPFSKADQILVGNFDSEQFLNIVRKLLVEKA